MFQCGRLLLVLLCSVALTLTGCSKKEGSSAAGGVNASAPDSELLERLPVTTLGFIFSENGSKAYAEYKGSPWYQPAEKYFEKLSSLESELPGLAVALTVAKKAALWDGAAEKPGFESVLFVAKGATGQQPDIGAITKAPSPIDPAAFLAAMENAMKEGGATPVREKVGEVEVLTTTMEINGSSSRKVYIVALPERYGMVSNPALIERLTRSLDTIPEGERGIRVLKNTPAFQRAQARATTVPGQFLFGFLAVTELEDVVRTALPPGTPGVNDGTVEALPFESISFCRSMSGGLHDYVWLGTKEGALPAEAVTALSGTSDHAGMRNAPVNAVGVLSLDGALLRAAKSTAVAGMTPEEQSQTASMSAPLEGMKGLTLVVRNAAGASPFPEITLMAETKDPAMLQATLKTVLGGLAAGGGLPVSQWQTKEIAGAKVDFIVSPIGVGLFMGTVKNSLVLSSADGAFHDLIGGKTAPEVKRFFEGDHLKGEKSPLVLFYLSGAKLVGLIESLQASLAMFTGGKNMVEPEDLAALRSLGEIGTAVSFSDAAFRVHSTYVAESGK